MKYDGNYIEPFQNIDFSFRNSRYEQQCNKAKENIVNSTTVSFQNEKLHQELSLI